MKENQGNKKMVSHQPNKNKKTTIQRQFFVCFCAKSYGSYSALYLHARKKHGKSISMEHMKFQNHEWSGNVKNIYYEFTQSICKEVVENESQVKLKAKKSPNKQSPKNRFVASCSSQKQSEVEKDSFFLKIEQIFQQYLRTKSTSSYESQTKIMTDFLKYLKKEIQKQFSPQRNEKTQFDNMMDIIPNIMNNFYQQYACKISFSKIQVISELELFSQWMYQRSYTKFLAIQHHKFQNFLNKNQK